MAHFCMTFLRSLTRLAIAGGFWLTVFPSPAQGQNVPYTEWPDDHWAEIAHRVPGFAGWWLDGGTIVLWLVDTTQRDAALQAVAAELPRRYSHNVRVRKADFDFIQLRDWKNLAIGDSSVVWSDADELQNRVVVGVVDSGSLASTRERLVAAGITSAALVLEIDGPVKWLRRVDVAPPNQRMKLSRRGGHFCRHLSVLFVAAAARSLCAIR